MPIMPMPNAIRSPHTPPPLKRFDASCFGLNAVSAAVVNGRVPGQPRRKESGGLGERGPGEPHRRQESGVVSERDHAYRKRRQKRREKLRALNGLDLENESSGELALIAPKTEAMCEGEQDYEVVFCESFLGIELRPRDQATKSGAVVTDCLTQYTHNFVERGSWVTSVNNRTVDGEPYEMIRRHIQLAQQNPPMTMTFRRSPSLNLLGQPGKAMGPIQGDLIFYVVVALNLKHDANFVEVEVDGQKVFTSTAKTSSRNPEFKQRLTFRKFRPAPGRIAKVKVGKRRRVRKDKVVGSCQIELPTSFSNMERHTIEISKKGSQISSGVLVLNSILVVL